MTKLFYFLLAIVGGATWGVQSSINSALGKKIGTLEGTLMNFAVGTLFMALVVLFFGRGNLWQIFAVPKWQLIGGVMGTFVIFMIILSIPKIGVASTMLAVISGQVLISVIIDHYGFFGMPRIPFDWQRGLGMLMLAGSLLLIFRNGA